VVGIPKFPGGLPRQAVLIDHPKVDCFPEELLVMPVVEKSTAVHCHSITVTMRNVSSHNVTLKRGIPIAHLFPVDVINTVSGKEGPKLPSP